MKEQKFEVLFNGKILTANAEINNKEIELKSVVTEHGFITLKPHEITKENIDIIVRQIKEQIYRR